MATGRKYCSTCRSSYRGYGGVHDSTARHRASIYRRQGKTSTRKARARFMNTATLYARQRSSDEAMVSVVKHRRRLPDDGPRFSVPVVHYWRREPYIASHAYGSHRRARG